MVIVAIVVVTLASYLSWHFTAGPGGKKHPKANDDNDGDVDRGSNSVDVDVKVNDADAQNATVGLIDPATKMNATGAVTVTGVGKWEVTTDQKVRFTPDAAYNFNTPAKISYNLSLDKEYSAAANITITYKPAVAPPPHPDPINVTSRGDYAADVPFTVTASTGKLEFVKPDPSSPNTQTVKDVGVWTIGTGNAIKFRADAKFANVVTQTEVRFDYGGTKSKTAVLTVVFNQPDAADIFIQGLNPGASSPPVDVVIRSHAVAPRTLDSKSVVLVGLQDLEMGVAPISKVSNDGKRMAADQEGVWLVSDDGHITFVPQPGENLVTSYTASSFHNNAKGFVGMSFVSAANQAAASLGIRRESAAATGLWDIFLTDAAGTVLAKSSIDLSSATVGDFVYGTAVNYRLTKGTTYYLMLKVDGSQPVVWTDNTTVALNSSVANSATAVVGTALGTYFSSSAGTCAVGIDFTSVTFLDNPTPAIYTISDDKGNVSNHGLVILNYGDPIEPSTLNDPDDTNFFSNLRRVAFDAVPAISHLELLTSLVLAANITASAVPAPGVSPITATDADTRYAAYKKNNFTTDALWDSCSDITPTLVDPQGAQPPLYARYWRVDTMRELLTRLLEEIHVI